MVRQCSRNLLADFSPVWVYSLPAHRYALWGLKTIRLVEVLLRLRRCFKPVVTRLRTVVTEQVTLNQTSPPARNLSIPSLPSFAYGVPADNPGRHLAHLQLMTSPTLVPNPYTFSSAVSVRKENWCAIQYRFAQSLSSQIQPWVITFES